MNEDGNGKGRKGCGGHLLAISAAIVVVILLLPTRFKGIAVGFLLEAWIVAIVLSLLRVNARSRMFGVLSCLLLILFCEWTKSTINDYAVRLGREIVRGSDWQASLEAPPFMVRVFCLGHMDWLKEECAALAQEWRRIDEAAADGNDVECERAIQMVSRRFDLGLTVDVSLRIVSKAANALRDSCHIWWGSCAGRAMLRRGSTIASLRKSPGASSVDIATFSNAVDYVEALFGHNGDENSSDIDRAKMEWSFAVGLPDDIPNTFPTMIPSAMDLSAFPREWAGGTNSQEKVYFTGVKWRIVCSDILPLLVGRSSGEVSQVDGLPGTRGYWTDMWRLLGERPYRLTDGTYFLTPTGKVYLDRKR